MHATLDNEYISTGELHCYHVLETKVCEGKTLLKLHLGINKNPENKELHRQLSLETRNCGQTTKKRVASFKLQFSLAIFL